MLKNSFKNNVVEDDDSLDIRSGSPLTALDINSKSTVQPNALLRLSVFTPDARDGSRHIVTTDVTEILSELNFSRSEGYDSITIRGPSLNMSVDFRVWRGVVRALNLHGFNNGELTISFKEFATLCGYPAKRLERRFRESIHESLARLRGSTLDFKKSSTMSGGTVTGLLLKGYWDSDNDIVKLLADDRLWDLYLLDHNTILKSDIFDMLPRQEVAQCLYTYIQSLPLQATKVSYKRLRERLQIKSDDRVIDRAVDNLKKIGYLRAYKVGTGRDKFLIIEKKCNKLSFNKV